MTTTTILLFGETGNGKSTLGNQLLGENAFKVSDDTKSETKITYGRKGTGDWSDFFVIDTPGLQDTELAVKERIQLVRYVKEHKKLNAIFIVFNYQQVRLSNNIKTMIKLFCNIFPMKDVGKHIGLVFTNSFTKRGVLTNLQKLSKAKKVLPEFRRVIKEVSGSDLATNIPTVFVDIDPEEGIDEAGKHDLERIKTWASFLPGLNVEEMKIPGENYIDENNKLKNHIEQLKIENNEKLKNDKDINKLEIENTKLKNDINQLKIENNNLKNELQKSKKLINNMQNQQSNINNNNEIIKLKDEIKLKEDKINKLKIELENEKNKNNKEYVKFDDIIVIKFISTDQIINNYPIKCLKTNTVAEVEEKLYKEYEEFRETNNTLISKGNSILRFKKITENNIKDGDTIQIIKTD